MLFLFKFRSTPGFTPSFFGGGVRGVYGTGGVVRTAVKQHKKSVARATVNTKHAVSLLLLCVTPGRGSAVTDLPPAGGVVHGWIGCE